MKNYRIVFEDGEAHFTESENIIDAINKVVEQNPEYDAECVIKAEELA